MSNQWAIENDTGEELTVRAPNGFAVELDANSADPRERFAYFAIRQQARDIDQLRARLASPAHAHLDGEHLNGMVDGCLLCQAITERDQLRAELAAAVAERDRYHYQALTLDMLAARTLGDEPAEDAIMEKMDNLPDSKNPSGHLIACVIAERDQLRARLAAIHSAKTVAIAVHTFTDRGPYKWLNFAEHDIPASGVELIARPTKD